MKYFSEKNEKDGPRFMAEAAKEAQKALCLRAKCGSVIVRDGEIIGRGYNAPPLDDIENRICLNEYNAFGKPGFDQTCCMHAEWRAIFDALKQHPKKIQGSQLFFVRVDESGILKKSGRPYCTVCSRLALDAGICEFILWHEDGICAYLTDEYNTLSYSYKE